MQTKLEINRQAELFPSSGETVPLREILRARNRRRRELRGVLRDRESAVNPLLDLKRGGITEKEHAPTGKRLRRRLCKVAISCPPAQEIQERVVPRPVTP
jgi:hypothetical protein